MKILKGYLLIAPLLLISNISLAQRNINDILDSTTVNNLLIISKKYGSVSFSGYMQPQFQYAQSKGTAAEFQGGNFGDNADNRFRLRRGRLRADYSLLNDDGTPSTYFVFQFDGTEQGVNVRDFWGRYYEHHFQLFSFTAGLAGRPFGNELQLSSSSREAPERGRMSQTLMKTERDLGVMISFNPRKKTAKLKNIQFDLGIYNGQGLSGPQEFDNSKDFVLRLSHKSYAFKKLPLNISGGFSALLGGLNHQLPVKYEMQKVNNTWVMAKDSSITNINKIAPRKYYGADIQLSTKKKSWKSELRAEFIKGLQTGTSTNSSTPNTVPVDKNTTKLPYYTRSFNGAYLTFVQTLNSTDNQLIFKYDWYDPNTKVKGIQINTANKFSAADVRFDTFGFGFLHHFNPHLKAVIYYDVIRNEKTKLLNFDKDIKDNVLTIRTQFYF
ncbi:porin [Pedobacter frigiditerrae]|uniref:Porin n=1 Tax=Pedobacter frigiditerrae TaxID=2530452 RepID=A0A4R0MK05_9SPHI|nr:porin [Pedobacter frigiditerrae]TCC86940.1 porin [Pedobacter frigiditerrae]